MRDWPNRKLGELVKAVRRPQAVAGDATYKLLGIRLDGGGPFHRETVLGTETSASKLYQVREGDFIYSRLFAWRGAFGLISPALDGHFVSNEFPTFAIDRDKLDPQFLLYWFRLPETLRRVEADCTGSTPLTRNRYKEEHFYNLEIATPDLAEQTRIAAKITRLSSVAGQALMQREIASKELVALESALIDLTYKSLCEKNSTHALKAVCLSITDGDHNTPAFADEGVKFIFVGNVSSGNLHFTGAKHVGRGYFDALSPTRTPVRGDILYTAVGATLGVPAIVDIDEAFCFQRHVAILKLDPTKVLPRYVWYMLRARTVFEAAWSATTGSAQPTIPLRAIRELMMPRTSLAEQRVAVARLDAHQKRIDAIRTRQMESKNELGALVPGLLDEAFKARL